MHVFSIQVTASRGFNHPTQADALAEAAKQKTLADIAAGESRQQTIDALEWTIRELLLDAAQPSREEVATGDAWEKTMKRLERDIPV